MKVVIEDGCIECGCCEAICEAVFTLNDIKGTAEVNQSAVEDDRNTESIREVVDCCPMGIIKIEED